MFGSFKQCLFQTGAVKVLKDTYPRYTKCDHKQESAQWGWDHPCSRLCVATNATWKWC